MEFQLAVAHEDLSRNQHVEGSSDRSFGLVIAGAFIVIGFWPLFHGEMLRWWSFCIAAVFALLALAKPALLAGLNTLWTRLGVLLGTIAGPIALAVLFYGVVTPIGAVMRLTGKDPLRLKRDPGAVSYWIPRNPSGPPPDSMSNQF